VHKPLKAFRVQQAKEQLAAGGAYEDSFGETGPLVISKGCRLTSL
jgi:hypothetical protein